MSVLASKSAPVKVSFPETAEPSDARISSKGPRQLSLYWRFQLAGWFGLGVIWLSIAMLHAQFALRDILWAIIFSNCGLAASHYLRHVIRSKNFLTASPSSSIPLLGARCALLGLLAAAFIIGSRLALYMHEFQNWQSALIPFLGTWAVSSMMLAGWCSVYFLYHHQLALRHSAMERAQLETAIRDAQLAGLKAQLNPHFLFNSLNTLRNLIATDAERARDVVTQLSELLRASLTDSRRTVATLAEELDLARQYLALEMLRFEERLRVTEEIEPAALKAEIPPLLLQTLVENAVKHGISQRKDGGEIRIAAWLADEQLHVSVRNPGSLTTSSSLPGGVGLANARERLRLIFGPSASLQLRAPIEGIVEAFVILPNHRSASVQRQPVIA